jgi:MAF protein
MQLVLASGSPRRRELLALLGLAFEVQATQTSEQRGVEEPPLEYVRRLSQDKARAAAASYASEEPALILAADTIVVDGDEALGKPADEHDATATLSRLRDRVHVVYTAITLLDNQTGRMETDIAESPVKMRDYTAEEIAAYVASGDPFDKAGAYAIQSQSFHPVESFAHCYANVMGLPLCHLARLLHRFGLQARPDLPTVCQRELVYDCPVHHDILDQPEA